MGILEIVKMQKRQEGRHTETLSIAREMKKDKFPIGTIAKLKKLFVSEIEWL